MGSYHFPGIFPKDNTQEFDNDLTITDWLTQYSEIKDATYVRVSLDVCFSLVRMV